MIYNKTIFVIFSFFIFKFYLFSYFNSNSSKIINLYQYLFKKNYLNSNDKFKQ